MRLAFVFLSFFVIINSLFAQTIKGRIVNDNDAAPLTDVVVQNLNSSNAHAISDNEGHYKINVRRGDSVRFSLLGFVPRIVIYTGSNEGWFSWIGMKQQSFAIDTVVVHKGLTQYQKDSSERREIFGKKVDYEPAKVRYRPLENPFVVESPISGLIEKHTRKYKRLKAFQESYAENESLKFIDSRYNPDSVSILTGLYNDSLIEFMKVYPMSYAFTRVASNLEVKMWIKYNYRLWMKLKEEKKP